MKKIFNRLWFSTCYPGIKIYIYLIIVSILSLTFIKPINNIRENINNDFSLENIDVVIILMYLLLLLIKIILNVKILYLSYIGWKKYEN